MNNLVNAQVKQKIFTQSFEINAFLASLEARLPGENEKVTNAVREITSAVREFGSEAVLNYRLKFEAVPANEPLVICVDQNFLKRATEKAASCPRGIATAIETAIARVRRYHEIQLDSSRTLTETDDAGAKTLAQFTSRIQPLDSAAVYVPGGKAFYPSSLIMSVVPAQVAGVKRICVVTPARSLENPTFLATILSLGVHEILATGGAQGVAAAAFGLKNSSGTTLFERCDKIVGPGNIYVATAKHQLSGRIGIDSFAGPSEILILADGSSEPSTVAADLLAQAEHDQEASSVLVTTSLAEAKAVEVEIEKLFSKLKDREPVARESWLRYGGIIVVQDKMTQVEIANKLNAEHLHVHTRCALSEGGRQFWEEHLKGVGAIFLGKFTAEVFGDYVAGPSHVLPTAGTARFASPLGVYDFMRRSSVLYMSPELAAKLAGPTVEFAKAEELWGHALAAQARNPGGGAL